SGQALRRLYPGGGDTLDFSGDQSLSQTFADLKALKEELAAKEGQAEALRQQLQQAMGDASRAVFATGEVTWRRAKDSTQLDSKRLTQDHPELVAQYTVLRPVTRRFVIVDTAA